MIVVTSQSIDAVAARLPSIIEEAGHSELYGIDMGVQPATPPVRLLIAKNLRARNNDVEVTVRKLTETLKWRREFNPLSAAYEEDHGSQYNGLAYITTVGNDSVCWSLFGPASKDTKAAFFPVEAYLRWRVGLQERAVGALNIQDYTGDGTEDTKLGVQVSDYTDVSMWKLDSYTRNASRAIVPPMTAHYVEVMRQSIFVSVPLFIRVLFTAFKYLLSQELIDKFVLVAGQQDVAKAAPSLKDVLPKVYGGASDKTLEQIAEPWIPRSRPTNGAVNGNIDNAESTRPVDDAAPSQPIAAVRVMDAGELGNSGVENASGEASFANAATVRTAISDAPQSTAAVRQLANGDQSGTQHTASTA